MAMTATATGIHATEARSGGMGISTVKENTWAVEGQLPYIYTNPAAIGNFGPMIFGEYGVFGGAGKGGIIFAPVSGFDLGIFVGHAAETAGTNAILANSPVDPLLLAAPVLSHQNASIMSRFAIGGITFGAGVSFARTSNGTSSKDTNTKVDVTQSSSTSVIKPVIGFYLDGKIKIDGSIGYRMNFVNNTYNAKNGTTSDTATNTYKNNGLGDIVTDVQAILDLGANLLHITAGFDYLDRNSQYSTTSTIGGTTSSSEVNYFNTGYKIKAGISDELKISNDVLAFVGLGFSLTNAKVTTPSTKTVVGGAAPVTGFQGVFYNNQSNTVLLPLFLGMETNLGEKWLARFGVSANLLNINPNSTNVSAGVTSTADTWSNATPTFNGGLSFKAANLSFDWNLSVSLLTNGPFFISGLQNAGGVASDFAVSYKFGEAKK